MPGDSLFTRVGQNVGQRTQRREIYSLYSRSYAQVLAERVGFEPTWALAPTDFESVPVWPLRYLSKGNIGLALCAATTSRTAHLQADAYDNRHRGKRRERVPYATVIQRRPAAASALPLLAKRDAAP